MIKKLLITVILGVFATPAATNATILIQDSFPGNGDLVGAVPAMGNTWANISGAPGTLDVSSGSVSILAGNNEDATSQFAAGQTGAIFAGFDFTLTSLPGISPTGGYLVSFRDGTAASGSYQGRLHVSRVSGSPANEFQVGMSNGNTNADDAGTALWNSNLSLNTNYRLILRFDTTTDDITLWVNPAALSSDSVTSFDTGADVVTLDGFAFRQASGNHGAASLDNLLVATSFTEVLNVPEPSTYLLFSLSLGILGILRRKSVSMKKGQATL